MYSIEARNTWPTVLKMRIAGKQRRKIIKNSFVRSGKSRSIKILFTTKFGA
jgi:hypothetical protein